MNEVSNSRLQLIRMEHPAELTKMLQSLASRGSLDQIGQKRATIYRLPAWAMALAPEAMALAPSGRASASPIVLPMALAPEAMALAPVAMALAPGAMASAPQATALAPQASPCAPSFPRCAPSFPVAPLPSAEKDPELLEIARPAREKPRLMRELTKTIIRKLCSGQFLTADQIAILNGPGERQAS